MQTFTDVVGLMRKTVCGDELGPDTLEPKFLKVFPVHDLHLLPQSDRQTKYFLLQLLEDWHNVMSRKCAQGHVKPHKPFELEIVCVVRLVPSIYFPQH